MYKLRLSKGKITIEDLSVNPRKKGKVSPFVRFRDDCCYWIDLDFFRA